MRLVRLTMMLSMAVVLGQMDQNKLAPVVPRLNAESSDGLTWVIAGIMLVAILLITFKISKRNAVSKD